MAWCCWCSCCLDENIREQIRVNRIIEREIERSKREFSREFKLLLLATGGVGKSTFRKQMRIIHGQGYSDKDRAEFRSLVYHNILDTMRDLVESMAILNIAYADPSNKKYESVVMGVNRYEATNITAEQKVAIQSLWKDPGVQRCYEKRDISDSAKYYFDSIERICEEDYIPTIDDVLCARVPTIGIHEYIFQMRDMTFRTIEMGGARSSRRKWIHCLDNVKAIIFFCAINEYNKVLFEDFSINKMKESLDLFKSVISYPWFCEASVIVFLNKTDLFLEEIAKSHLTDYFPAYQGPKSDPEAAKQFIKQLFLSANPEPNKRIFCHFTQATNTENIKEVFQDVCEILLRRNLKDYKLM